MALERTCWRGLRVDHPADWELALASGWGEPVRCVFADRYFQRLEVRCQKARKAPNLALMLERHRINPDGEARELTPLGGCPPGWYCLMRKTHPGVVVHAAKAVPTQGVLVEATIVWPERRDTGLESGILASVGVDDRPANSLWQAMGISLELSSQFDLRSSTSTVGQVKWEFASEVRSAPHLTVERLAMPEHWLKGAALRDWLTDQLPPRQEVINQELVPSGNHRACRLVSRGSIGALARLRGLYRLRLDLAWQCPVENRIYHLTAWQVSRDNDLDPPGGARVTCCRPVHLTANRRAAH